MTNTASRIAGIATLALAALPVVALATGANAAPAPVVKVGDLNLNSAAGMATFQQRADQATKILCRGVTRPGSRLPAEAACEAAVKSEIAEKLDYARTAQLSRGADFAAR